MTVPRIIHSLCYIISPLCLNGQRNNLQCTDPSLVAAVFEIANKNCQGVCLHIPNYDQCLMDGSYFKNPILLVRAINFCFFCMIYLNSILPVHTFFLNNSVAFEDTTSNSNTEFYPRGCIVSHTNLPFCYGLPTGLFKVITC